MPIAHVDFRAYEKGELEIVSFAGEGSILRGSIRHLEYRDGLLGAMLLWQAQGKLLPTEWVLNGTWIFYQCDVRSFTMKRGKEDGSLELSSLFERTMLTLRKRGSRQILLPSRVRGLDLEAALGEEPDTFGWPKNGSHLYAKG